MFILVELEYLVGDFRESFKEDLVADVNKCLIIKACNFDF